MNYWRKSDPINGPSQESRVRTIFLFFGNSGLMDYIFQWKKWCQRDSSRTKNCTEYSIVNRPYITGLSMLVRIINTSPAMAGFQEVSPIKLPAPKVLKCSRKVCPIYVTWILALTHGDEFISRYHVQWRKLTYSQVNVHADNTPCFSSPYFSCGNPRDI